MNYMNHIYNEDCIAGMSRYPDHSIDMILCDLPYGMTGCRWDSILPFDLLWQQYLRIIKLNGAIALTGCQPFTTRLISSNPKHFKYCWYWYKNMVTGFANAKKQPLRCIEEVCIFYQKQPTYNPQGIIVLDHPIKSKGKKSSFRNDDVYGMDSLGKDTYTCITHYPRQVAAPNPKAGGAVRVPDPHLYQSRRISFRYLHGFRHNGHRLSELWAQLHWV